MNWRAESLESEMASDGQISTHRTEHKIIWSQLKKLKTNFGGSHPELPGGSVTPSNYGLTPGYMAGTMCVENQHNRHNTDIVFVPRWHKMASPTQMHNASCRSVTIEARFTAYSRSSGSHREWTHLHGGIWREFGDDRNRRVFGMGGGSRRRQNSP
jgi:hypothetical protein